MYLNKINFLTEYETASTNIKIKVVHSEKLQEFQNCVYQLNSLVNQENSEDLEKSYQSFKYIFNQLRSSFIPYSKKMFYLLNEEIQEEITSFFKQLIEYNTDSISLVKHVITLFREFKDGKIENELQNTLTEMLNNIPPMESVVIVTNSVDRLDRANINQRIDYVKPSKLMQLNRIYNKLIFLGSPYIYSQFSNVFLGKEIVYLSYDFYQNKIEKKYILGHSSDKNSALFSNVEFDVDNEKNTGLLNIEEELLEESINHDFGTWLNKFQRNIKNNEELYRGILFGLESGNKIIYPEKKKISILDLNTMKIDKKEVELLSSNELIIERLHTENDYLVEEAKKMYGKSKYLGWVTLIQSYKTRLNHSINKDGLTFVKQQLNNEGVGISSDLVIKNWATMNVIAPMKNQDFDILLKFLDFNNTEITHIKIAAKSIINAHREIGRLLSKKIQDIIESVDQFELYSSLQEEKKYEFIVDGVGEYTIEQISKKFEDIVKIPSGEFRKIF